jgi:hypothetical protein
MRKQDYKLETDPGIVWKLRRTKELSCPHCPPNRIENAKKKGKRGSRPPKSKNRKKS